MSTNSILLVAQTTPLGGYFSYYKLGTFVVLFLLWCMIFQWVDRDTDVVKTKREQWNIIVLSGGIVGLAVFLLVPWKANLFFLGLAFWIVAASGSALAYVVHRNGRVVPAARVLTADHFKRLMQPKERAKKRDDEGIRVRLADAEGKAIDVPEDPDAYQQFLVAQDFLFDMLWRRASDADLVVGQDQVRVLYRIDGVATDASDSVTRDDAERVLTFLKTTSGQNPNERRRPQRGELHVGLLTGADLGIMEVQTSGSTKGEHLRLKINEAASLKRIQELGIAPQRLETLKERIAKPTGVMLFSGPAGSGVTTTAYAVLKAHDAFTQNIYTLESRTLLDLDNITQYKHNSQDSDVGFARQLQTVLRREPDIVMVGECPDRETAQIAMRSAADDKKIYMCIQGIDCFDALERFRKVLDDHALLGKALLAVTNQRLVRVLCTECRQGYKPDPGLLKKANLPADKIEFFYRPPTEPILDKKGNEIICSSCQGTGYLGRTGVFEVLKVDEAVSQLLTRGADMREIKSACRKNKMYYLQEEGLFRVIEGATSMNEVIRALKAEAR